MKKLVLGAMLVVVALVVGSPAEADTIYVSENEMGPFGTNLYNGGTLGLFPSDFNGQMILTANVGSSPTSMTFNMFVWCVDQPGFIGLGVNPSVDGTAIIYTIESLADFTTDFNGNTITSRQASEIAALANIGDQMLRVSPSNVVANAVQAAITNVEYGTTSDGGPDVNAETANLLTFVSGLTSAQLASYQAVILVDGSGSLNQHLISSVPEPASLFLLGTGLIGLIGSRRASQKTLD